MKIAILGREKENFRRRKKVVFATGKKFSTAVMQNDAPEFEIVIETEFVFVFGFGFVFGIVCMHVHHRRRSAGFSQRFSAAARRFSTSSP